MPTGKQLTATITKLDAGLFGAYNDCDLTSSYGPDREPHLK